MTKVIFIGGIKGVGKTTILKNIKIKKLKLTSIILKSKGNWNTIQENVGKKIKNLAFKQGTIIVELHYGVPKESLIKINERKNINFSGDFEESITKLMLRNMKDVKIEFLFCYINVKTNNIIRRLKDSEKISQIFLRNITKIKKIDKMKFIKIFNTAKRLGLNARKKIIYNDNHLKKTIKDLEKII